MAMPRQSLSMDDPTFSGNWITGGLFPEKLIPCRARWARLYSRRMHEKINLTREVSAIQIPSGDSLTLPAGTEVYITQRLGGTYTVATSQGLARISAQDADALGVDSEEEKKKHAESARLKDAPLEEQVWAQLKGVYDPEIPVDIVNLGLVYDCAIEDIDGKTVVMVKMTLTAPGCGMGPVIAADAQAKIMTIDGIDDARVELVWDPAWNQEMISEEGKMKLGMI
jgi:probable FeS assembly SUF system protein SufT